MWSAIKIKLLVKLFMVKIPTHCSKEKIRRKNQYLLSYTSWGKAKKFRLKISRKSKNKQFLLSKEFGTPRSKAMKK